MYVEVDRDTLEALVYLAKRRRESSEKALRRVIGTAERLARAADRAKLTPGKLTGKVRI